MIINNAFGNANVNVIMPSISTPAAPAWAQFGKVYDTPVSINDVFDDAESGLNYEVTEQPLMRVPKEIIEAIKKGDPFEWTPNLHNIVESHKATVYGADGHTLGVVGKNYGIVQNRAAMEFINFIEECSGTAPEIVSAGYLGHGEKMFVTARLGEDSYIEGNDAYTTYVVFTNTHDGTGSLCAMITPIRVICQNTLNMALNSRESGKLVYHHTSRVNERIDLQIAANRQRAAEVFSAYGKFKTDFIAQMINLKGQMILKGDVAEFAAKMTLNDAQYKLWTLADRNVDRVDEISTRTKNSMNALITAIESGIGQNQHRGSKLWLLNGLTTYLHNERKWSSAQTEYQSLMEGQGRNKVQKAYNLLIAA